MKKKKTLKKTLNPYMITFGAVLGASSLGLGIYYGVYEKYYYEPKTILDQIQNLKNDANLNYYFSDELNQLQQDYENIKKTKSNEPIFDGLQQQINRLILKQQLIKKDENNITLNNNEKTYLGNYINKEFEEVLKYVDKNNPESYYSYLDSFYQKSIDNFITQSKTSKGKSKEDFRNILIRFYHTEKGVLERIKDTKQKIQTEIDAIKELLQNVNDSSKRKQKILLNLNTNILDKIKQQKILAQQLKDQVDLYNQNLNQIIDVNVNNTQLEYWSTQLSYYEGINQKINLLNHHKFSVSDFKELSFITIKKSTILNDVNHKFYDEVIKNNYDKNESMQYFLAYEYQIKNDDLGIVSKVFKKLIPLEYDGRNNQVYLEFKQTHPKFYANYKNKFDIKEQYFYVENDAFLKESFVRKEIIKLKDYYDNERRKSIKKFNDLLIKIENTNFKKIDEFNTKSFSRWKQETINPVSKLTTYLDDLQTNRFVMGDDATWYSNWNDDYIDNNDLIITTIENNYVRLVNLLINNQFYTNLYNNQKNKIATIQHKTIEDEKTWKQQNPNDDKTIFLHNNTFLKSIQNYVRDRSFNINDPNQTFTKTLNKNNDTINLLDENKINNLQLLTSNLENNSFYDLLKQFIVAYDRVLDWYNANNRELVISKLKNRPNTKPRLENINLVNLKSFSDLFFYKTTTNEHNETTKSIDQSQDIIKLYFDGILNTKQMQDLETNLNNAVAIINQGVSEYNKKVFAKLNEYNWNSKYDHETIFYNELIKQLNPNVSLLSLETSITDYFQHIENNKNNIKLKSDVTTELNSVNTASLNINYDRQLYNDNENNPNSYNQKIINKHNELKTQLENYEVDSLYTNKSQLLTVSTYLNNLRNIITKTNDSINLVNTFKTNPFSEISLTLNQNVDPKTHPDKTGRYTKSYMLSLSNQQLKSKVQETTTESTIFNIDDINHMYYIKDKQKWNYIALETYINGINENKQIKKDFVLQRNDLVFFDNPMEVSVFVTKNINIEENGFSDGDIEVIKDGARNIRDIFNLYNYNQTQLTFEKIFKNYKKWILLNSNQGLENVSNTQLLENQTNLLQSMRYLTSKTIANIRDYEYQDFLILKTFLETNTINRNNNTLYSDAYLKSKYNGIVLNRFITNEDVKSFIKGIRKNFVDPFTNIRWNGYWDYNFVKSEYKPKLDDKFNRWIYTNPFIKNVIYNNSISDDDKTKMLLYYIVNELPITPENNPFDTSDKMKTTLKSLYTNQNHLFVIDNPNDNRNNRNTKTYERLYNHLKWFYKFNIKMYANPVRLSNQFYQVDTIEFEYSHDNGAENPSFKTFKVGKLLEDLYKKANEMDTMINLYDILLKPNYHSFNNLTSLIKANKEKTLFNKTTNNNWEYYNLRLEKNNNVSNNPNFANLFNPYGFKYLLNIHITKSQSTYDAMFNNLDLWSTNGKITSYQQLINTMGLNPRDESGDNIITPLQFIDNVKRRLLEIQSDYKKLLNYSVKVIDNRYSIVYDNDHVLFSGANFDNKLITLLENDSNNVANAKKLKNPVLYKFQPLIWIPSKNLHYNASVLINNNFRISDLLKSKDINVWRNVFNVSEDNPNYTEINENASVYNNNFISKWDKEYDEPNGWNNLTFIDETDYDYGINTIDHLFSVNHYIKNNKVFRKHILPYTYSANHYSKYKSLFTFINTYPNDLTRREFNLWGTGSSYNSN